MANRDQRDDHRARCDPSSARSREQQRGEEERHTERTRPAAGRREREAQGNDEHVRVGEVAAKEPEARKPAGASDARANVQLATEQRAIPIDAGVVLHDAVPGRNDRGKNERSRELSSGPLRRGATRRYRNTPRRSTAGASRQTQRAGARKSASSLLDQCPG